MAHLIALDGKEPRVASDAYVALTAVLIGNVAIEEGASVWFGAVLRRAVEALTPVGVCGLIGAAPLGTEASLDMNDLLIPGKTVRGIVEGDSVPDVFIPRLVDLHAQGRFPFDRLVRSYPLDEINAQPKPRRGARSSNPCSAWSRLRFAAPREFGEEKPGLPGGRA